MLPRLENNPYVDKTELSDFLRALSTHPAGRSLASQQRWLRFKHQLETPEYWRSALGPTVNVFDHQPYFVNFLLEVMKYVPAETFTDEEIRQLILAFLCHDCGEAKIEVDNEITGVGDVAAPFKTELLEKEEHRIGLFILSQLSLQTDAITEFIIAYREVVIGENPKLNQFFKAIERLEYLSTAMTAYINVLLEDEGSHHLTTVYDWNLVAGVLSYDFIKIMDVFYLNFPEFFDAYFAQYYELIDGMFSFAETALSLYTDAMAVKEDNDSLFGAKRFQDLNERLPAAIAKWENWRDTHVGKPEIVSEGVADSNVTILRTVYTL